MRTTHPAGLDTLIAAGEVAWAGVEPIGERDGRIALFLADKLPLLAQQRPLAEPLTEREEKLLAVLESTGASFFDPLHQAVGGGYPGETIDALWSLVWRGLVTNDSLHALRAYIARPESARTPRRSQTGAVFRSRRTTPPDCARPLVVTAASPRAEPRRSSRRLPGRASDRSAATRSPCNCSTATACCCANRSRPKMFPADSARSTTCSRRSKRAAASAADILSPALAPRNSRCPPPSICCASCAPSRRQKSRSLCSWPPTDPANPYGSVLRWPDLPVATKILQQIASLCRREAAPRILTRAAYAEVILRNGQLVAWLRRSNPNLLVFLPADEPERSQAAAGLAHFLCARGQERMQGAAATRAC